MSPRIDLMTLALAHPWVLGLAGVALLTGVILVLLGLYKQRVEDVLSLYRQPDDDPHSIELEQGRFRVELVRRSAGWRFRVTCRDHDLKPSDVVVTTIRPDGLGQRFDFARRGRRLESIAKVREPLVFVAKTSISWAGVDYTFVIGFGGSVAPLRARYEVVSRPESKSGG